MSENLRGRLLPVRGSVRAAAFRKLSAPSSASGSVRLAADQRGGSGPQYMTDLFADIRTYSDNVPSGLARCPSAWTADALNGLNVYIFIYLYIALFPQLVRIRSAAAFRILSAPGLLSGLSVNVPFRFCRFFRTLSAPSSASGSVRPVFLHDR